MASVSDQNLWLEDGGKYGEMAFFDSIGNM